VTDQHPALTYSAYLSLDDVLSAQHPRSDEHDELLFIVIHQVYELWFKQLLHELDYASHLLETDQGARAQHTLKRVLTILKVMVHQLDVLETMTPLEFLSFRQRLDQASGFQSDQFRQFEFVLGFKTPHAVARFPPGSRGQAALQARLEAPTLWDAFLRSLAREGSQLPAEVLARDVTQPITPSPAVQDALVQLYRTDPKNGELCERLVDLDEGVQEWRYRHVKMVERTIGVKMGTGGSSGAGYLRTTLNTPAFPDLWEIRSRM